VGCRRADGRTYLDGGRGTASTAAGARVELAVSKSCEVGYGIRMVIRTWDEPVFDVAVIAAFPDDVGAAGTIREGSS
jgi:hypothetical protein